MKTRSLVVLRILAIVLAFVFVALVDPFTGCTLVLVRGDGNSFADTRGDTKGTLNVNRKASRGPASDAAVPPIIIQHKAR